MFPRTCIRHQHASTQRESQMPSQATAPEVCQNQKYELPAVHSRDGALPNPCTAKTTRAAASAMAVFRSLELDIMATRDLNSGSLRQSSSSSQLLKIISLKLFLIARLLNSRNLLGLMPSFTYHSSSRPARVRSTSSSRRGEITAIRVCSPIITGESHSGKRSMSVW